MDNSEDYSKSMMTGKSLQIVENAIRQFNDERNYKMTLKNMEIEDYIDNNGIDIGWIKILVLRGKGQIYENKLIKIRIEFPDAYPNEPPQMYFEPLSDKHQKKIFLHANVYQFNGQICHPLLHKSYFKDMKLSSLFKSIEQLIYHPNFNNPANYTISGIYNKDQSHDHSIYIQKIKENASFLEDGPSYIQSDSEDD